MTFNKYFVLLCLSIGISACKDSKPKSEEQVQVVQTQEDKAQTNDKYSTAKTTAVFKDPKVAQAYENYLAVKTALVNANRPKAAQEADLLMTAFANLGVDQEALLAAQLVKESNTLDGQRKALSQLTPHLEKLVSEALESGTVYKQYCPMALNNTGAYWLANSEEIYNPYFGDMMLKCGRVSDTFNGEPKTR